MDVVAIEFGGCVDYPRPSGENVGSAYADAFAKEFRSSGLRMPGVVFDSDVCIGVRRFVRNLQLPGLRSGPCPGLVERLKLYDRRLVVRADPKHRARSAVVDVSPADVGETGQRVFDELAALWIEP